MCALHGELPAQRLRKHYVRSRWAQNAFNKLCWPTGGGRHKFRSFVRDVSIFNAVAGPPPRNTLAWPMPHGREIQNSGFQICAISIFNAVAGPLPWNTFGTAHEPLTRQRSSRAHSQVRGGGILRHKEELGGSMRSGALYVLFVRFRVQPCRWAVGSRSHSAAAHRTHRQT